MCLGCKKVSRRDWYIKMYNILRTEVEENCSDRNWSKLGVPNPNAFGGQAGNIKKWDDNIKEWAVRTEGSVEHRYHRKIS